MIFFAENIYLPIIFFWNLSSLNLQLKSSRLAKLYWMKMTWSEEQVE